LIRIDLPRVPAKSLEPSRNTTEEEPRVAIPPELEAQILRYYHVEKWRAGTIARQLGVHHGTVDRVLSQAGLPKAERSHRPSQARSLPAIHPRDPGEVSDPDRQPAVCDGAQQRLLRWPRSLPPSDLAAPAPPGGRGVPTLADPAWGASARLDWGHFEHLPLGRARGR
jgi:predicted DNA-binding protein (UPF0251 family)